MNKAGILLTKYLMARHLVDAKPCGGPFLEKAKLSLESAKAAVIIYFTEPQLDEHYKEYRLDLQIMSSLERTYDFKWETFAIIEYQGNKQASKLEVLKSIKEQLDVLIEEYEEGDEELHGITIEERI